MCLTIDSNVTSLNKRTVWKVFDKPDGKIVSLYMGATYPKGKLVERSPGPASENGQCSYGLHFFLRKSRAKHAAKWYTNSYIAKFAVDPKDFMFVSTDGDEVTYERATRVGNFIKVG